MINTKEKNFYLYYHQNNMQRFWHTNYKDGCNPLELNKVSILRWDNVIIDRPEEIEDTCWECNQKQKCIDMLKRMKKDLYNNMYNKWQNKN